MAVEHNSLLKIVHQEISVSASGLVTVFPVAGTGEGKGHPSPLFFLTELDNPCSRAHRHNVIPEKSQQWVALAFPRHLE